VKQSIPYSSTGNFDSKKARSPRLRTLAVQTHPHNAVFATLQPGTQIAECLYTLQKERSMKAIVIGAGIGGLSAAVALKKAGIDCTVFEAVKRSGPSGRPSPSGLTA
jgi:FAD-dependent urate hydroxylase